MHPWGVGVRARVSLNVVALLSVRVFQANQKHKCDHNA